jgi:murein L,D-transpeptidase YafK
MGHGRMRALSRRSVLWAAPFLLAQRAFAAGLDARPLKADRIRVLKSERVLQLLANGVLLKSYPIALGRHPKGAKERLGDGRTPEGFYLIDRRTARTPYHRALHVSYPNIMDIRLARAAHVNPGGAIFIHGMPASFGHHDPVRFFVDWTDGCIAVGNIAVEEIWDAADDGTVIEILP